MKNATIDAHQHFWQLSQPFDYAWLAAPTHTLIRRDFLPHDLEPLIRASEIDRTIVVQTQHDLRENQWALELASRNDFIAGVVGWVDLASAECERQLLELMHNPRFVGVRHITQDEPDDDFIVREDVASGLRFLEKHGVPFDLLFYQKHLRHAATLARRFPELPMVIDHLAKPAIKDGRSAGWIAELHTAARFPNVFCKLSGMVTEADWTTWKPSDLRPYVQAALDAFGPGRLMFGSDWPVCLLAAEYDSVKSALVEALGPLSGTEHAAVFGGTAALFYRIGE